MMPDSISELDPGRSLGSSPRKNTSDRNVRMSVSTAAIVSPSCAGKAPPKIRCAGAARTYAGGTMCGVGGVYRRAFAADRELLLAMAGELRHRGPDGTGL